MEPKPISSGELVARRYRATRRIASGAMGEVWEAVHDKLGHRVALKVLRKESYSSPEIVKRFTREAFLLARIESEHVVRIFDFVARTKHGPVLVMEMIEGESLSDVASRDNLSVEEGVDLAIDLLRALATIHARQVIHRDVKPGNIMLRKTEDGKRRAVLVDFGVGRLIDESIAYDGDVAFPIDGEEMTSADRVVGTVEYMAPEQIVSCQTAAASVDAYAVGAVVYRVVSGHHPFGDVRGNALLREKTTHEAPPMHLERKDPIARELVAIVARAMATKPSERFASAAELLEALVKLRTRIDLAQIVELAEEDARPIEPPQLPNKRRPRRHIALVVAALFATAFAACSTDVASRAPHAASTTSP